MPTRFRVALRRSLALSALVTAGALAYSPRGDAAVTRYVSGSFGVVLDDKSVGYVTEAGGGSPVGTVVMEPSSVPGTTFKKKHTGSIKYDDITFSFSTVMSQPLYDWIKATLSAPLPPRKNGALVVTDYNHKEISRTTWANGFISDITFPSFDAAARDAGKFKLSVTPEFTRRVPGTPAKTSSAPPLSKRLLASGFRLKIAGLESATSHAVKIEALSVRFKVQSADMGELRDYQKTPGSVDVSNLVFVLPEAYAADLYKWQEDFVVKGNNSDDKEKTGTLEATGPDGKEVIYTIGLKGLGIVRVAPDGEGGEPGQVVAASARAEGQARVRAELYVESITFDGRGADMK